MRGGFRPRFRVDLLLASANDILVESVLDVRRPVLRPVESLDVGFVLGEK